MNKMGFIKELSKQTGYEYDISMRIITGEIKNKLRHPFKSQD